MNDLYLSETMIAKIFWTELQSETLKQMATRDLVEYIFPHADAIAHSYPSRTGSISRKSAELIWLLARYFEPKSIAEVGTYIGRSTLSLYKGAEQTLASLSTCDVSFSAWRAPDNDAKSKIRYFGKTGSQEMFKALADEGAKIDLFMLDGRITAPDLELIEQLYTPKSVFIVDDFEGVEKGVENVFLLRNRFKDLLLLSPEPELSVGWHDSHCLAVLVPIGNVQITRQIRLPLAMM